MGSLLLSGGTGWDWWPHHHHWAAGDGDRHHHCHHHQEAGERLGVDGQCVADSQQGVVTASLPSSLTAGGGGCVVIITSWG